MVPYSNNSSGGRAAATSFLVGAVPAILCGVAGFLSEFTVSIVGLVPIGELVLMPVFVWAVTMRLKSKRWNSRIQQLSWYRLMLIALGLTVVGYLVSDLYRGTPNIYMLRGFARVSFLAMDFVAIAFLIDRSWVRLRIFVFALALGFMADSFVTGMMYSHWWEFGVGPPVASLSMYLIAGLPAIVQLCVAGLIGATSIAFAARSLGGITLLSGALVVMRYARGWMRPLSILAVVGAMGAVVIAAQHTIEDNPDKISSNIERTSMIETAAEDFIGSPLIGQGTWYSSSRMMKQIEEHRSKLDPRFHGYSEEEAQTITIHSQILVSLAEGGILGGAFFIVYGSLILKTIRTLSRYSVPHRAFVLYLLVDGLWSLCMSPFSGVSRVSICMVVCASLLVVLQRQDELSENYRE